MVVHFLFVPLPLLLVGLHPPRPRLALVPLPEPSLLGTPFLLMISSPCFSAVDSVNHAVVVTV